MTLSSLHWLQFTEAAAAFAQKWANEINEKAEAKSFWDGFFAIFGLDRYRLARHEQAVHRPGRDKAVDASYGLKKGFASEAKQVAWLFEMYGEAVTRKTDNG